MKYYRLIRTTFLVSALAASAAVNGSAASFTAINTSSASPSLLSVLDAAYGAGNYEQVSDDLDAIWTSQDLIGATAIGKYANATQQLGICLLCDGSDNVLIGPAVTQNGAISVALFDETFVFGSPSFRWFDAASGDPHVATVYSDPSLNPRAVDQMVTFAIKDSPGVFVLGFEDWVSKHAVQASDRDFNDFVVEVRFAPETPILLSDPTPPTNEGIPTVPEPAGIALLGGALLALELSRRAQRSRR